MDATERDCLACGQRKPLEDFHRSPKGKFGRSARCKDCSRPRQNAQDSRGRDRLRKAKDGPCADCGGRFPPCVMDFDHVRGQKSRIVSQMRHHPDAVFYAEVAKCDLVCSNCHRIRTYERGQWGSRTGVGTEER